MGFMARKAGDEDGGGRVLMGRGMRGGGEAGTVGGTVGPGQPVSNTQVTSDVACFRGVDTVYTTEADIVHFEARRETGQDSKAEPRRVWAEVAGRQ